MKCIGQKMIGTAIFILFFTAGISGAQPCRDDGGRWNCPPDGKTDKRCFAAMAEDLHLSAAQQQQITAAREKHRKEARAMSKQMRHKRDQLRKELQKPDLDRQKIANVHAQLKTLLVKQEDRRLESALSLRTILTVEQFTQFNRNLCRHKGKKGGKCKRAQNDCPPPRSCDKAPDVR